MKQTDAIAAMIVSRITPVMARVDDERVASGELMTEGQAHNFVSGRLENLFEQVRLQLCSHELAQQCEGRTQAEIRVILKGRLDAIRMELAL